MPRRAVLLTALSLAALAGPGAGVAPAALTQESTFQDDNRLIYDTRENVAATLDTLRDLGVDRVRVTVLWKVVAPEAGSRTKPAFDAADPGAYPFGAWDRYDTVLREALARGIQVNFNVTAPAPLWATGTPGREDLAETWEPDAREFDLFVRAAGTRYSGSYVPSGGDGTPLPRVDYWSIWNEPNQAGWLTPQWTPDPRDGAQQIEASPRLYRDLVDAAYDALDVTGHGGDTILIGETAPKGLNVTGISRSMKPGRFLRRVYCLDDAYAPLQGTSAEVRGCPVGEGARERFVADHPGLFKITGIAHHPYELTFAPTRRPRDRDFFTIANLDAFQGLWRRVFGAYGQPLPGGGRSVPLYLTEYGYQTNPPDPTGVSQATQARYLNQSEYLTARRGDVRTLGQFLLTDDRPLPGFRTDTAAAWGSTFQTGLLSVRNRPKPAFSAYRLPVHLPRSVIRRGRSLRVFGLVRPAPAGSAARVDVQQRSGRRGSRWRRIKRVTVTNERHYLDTRVRVRSSGKIRLVWRPRGGRAVVSRAATYTVRASRRR